MRFRFYGAEATQWTGDCLEVEIAFVAAPSDAALEKLGADFQRHFARLVEPGSSWQWSGRFAYVILEPRWSGGYRQLLGKLTAWLLALRQPIEQVVRFDEVGNAGDAWTRASRSVQTTPTPGPPFVPPMARPFGQQTDASLSAFERKTAFEAGRAAAVEQTILGTRSKKGVGFARLPETFRPQLYSDEIESKFRIDVDEKELYGRPYRHHRDGSDTPTWFAGRPIAGIFRSTSTSKWTDGIAYLDDTGERREVRGLPSSFLGFDVDVTNDGRRGFVFTIHTRSHDGRTVVEQEIQAIDFITGEARPIWKAPHAVSGIACTGERVLALLTPDLVLLDPRDGDAVEVTRIALGRKSSSRRHWQLWGRADGALAVVQDSIKHELTLVAVVDDKLTKLDTLKCDMTIVRREGDLHFIGGSGTLYVLDGVDELIARAAGKS